MVAACWDLASEASRNLALAFHKLGNISPDRVLHTCKEYGMMQEKSEMWLGRLAPML